MTQPEAVPGQTVPDRAVPDNGEAITGLTDLLVKAVRALGAAGEADQASRLAAKAWWVLKDWPRQAERVNGTMHYLARLPPASAAPSEQSGTVSEAGARQGRRDEVAGPPSAASSEQSNAAGPPAVSSAGVPRDPATAKGTA